MDALCCGMQVHFETTDHLLNQCPIFTIFINPSILWSRDSVVGIATHHGLDGPGIKSRWGRDFPHLSRLALRATQPPILWVPGLSLGGKVARAWH